MENPRSSVDELRAITGMYELEDAGESFEDRLVIDIREHEDMINAAAEAGVPEEELAHERAAIINMLDERCVYMKQIVIASGIAMRIKPEHMESNRVNDGESVYMEELLESRPMISHGYGWHKDERDNRWKVGHVLVPTDADEIQQEYIGFLHVQRAPLSFSFLDDIELAYIKTGEDLHRQLHVSVPEILEDLNVAIYGPESFEDRIKKLGEIKLSDYSSDIPEDILADTSVYIIESMDFDIHVPYEFDLSGSFSYEDSNGQERASFFDHTDLNGGQQSVLCFVEGVTYANDRIARGGKLFQTEDMKIALTLRVVHDEEGNKAPYRISVLAKDILRCTSLREYL